MEAPTQPHLYEPAFQIGELDPATEYRSLSVLAIISLIFGLAAPLCFVGPLLMAIPLFGIAVAILALRQIDASEGVLAGRWAAVLGLALCVGSITSAITHDFVGKRIRAAQAAKFGEDWLKLIAAGRAAEAFRLTVDAMQPSTAPTEPGAPPPAKTPYQNFLERPLVKSVAAIGAGAKVTLVDTVSVESRNDRRVYVVQQFDVTADGSASAKPVQAFLSMQRGQLPREGGSRWLVYHTADAPPPPSFPSS